MLGTAKKCPQPPRILLTGVVVVDQAIRRVLNSCYMFTVEHLWGFD